VLKLLKELATSLPRIPENDIIILTKSLSQEAKNRDENMPEIFNKLQRIIIDLS
jgi:hypothetical protein